MFCPCLFGVLVLFGALSINGQCHYLVLYTFGPSSVWCYICPDILVCLLVFYKYLQSYLVLLQSLANYIIVSVTFSFGVIAISPI